jgi:MFS transporter, FHS family, L-fucose permease
LFAKISLPRRMPEVRNVPIPNRKRILATFGVSYILLACGLSVPAALPELRRSVAMSDAVTALHGSFFGWGSLLGGLFGARVIARLGRLHVLVGSSVALGIGAVVFGTAHSVAQSLAGAALVGLGGAALVISVPGLVADVFGAERNKIFTRLNVAPGIGGLAFPLALSLAPGLGISWRVPTTLLPAGLLAVVIVLVEPLLRRGSRARTFPAGRRSLQSNAGSSRDVIALLKHRSIRRRFVMQIVAVMVEFSLGTWIVVFLRENGGFSQAAAPLGGVVWAIGMMSSRALTPKLIQHLGPRLEAACFSGGIVGALIVVQSPTPVLRIAGAALAAFSFGPMYTLGVERLFVNGEAVGVTDTTLISALAAVASGVAITAGPFVIGVVADQVGLTRALLLVPAFAAIGVVACLVKWGGEAGSSGQLGIDALTAIPVPVS